MFPQVSSIKRIFPFYAIVRDENGKIFRFPVCGWVDMYRVRKLGIPLNGRLNDFA